MRIALFGLLLVAGTTGCGPAKPSVDNSQDPEAYARDVKNLAFNAAESAAKSREPADDLLQLTSELEQQDRPRGSYGNVYEKLLKTANDIKTDCQKQAGGRPANLPSRLAELKKIAQELPGEVKLAKPEGRGSND